jgi:hypothetical protein
MEKTLKICEKCKGYEYEGPRFINLGPFSGEEFRKKHLTDWLNNFGEQEKLTIDFEGTKMYSPSFLEESFGGVIRNAKTEKEAETNRKKLKLAEFINIDPDWKKKLDGYIDNAKFNNGTK